MSDTLSGVEQEIAEKYPRRPSALAIPVSQTLLDQLVGAEDQILTREDAVKLVMQAALAPTSPDMRDVSWAEMLSGLPFNRITQVPDETPSQQADRVYVANLVANLVVDSIPEDKLSPALLSGLDLRTYMQAVASNPVAAEAMNPVDPEQFIGFLDAGAVLYDPTVNQPDVAGLASSMVEQYTKAQIEFVRNDRAESGGLAAPLSAAEIASLSEFSVDEGGLNVAGRTSLAGSAVEAGVVDDPNGIITGSTDIDDLLGGMGDTVIDEGPMFDRAAIEQFVRQGITSVEGMAQDMIEAQVNGTTPLFDYGMDVGQTGQGIRRGPDRPDLDNTQRRAGATMSAIDALDWIHTLRDDEVESLQGQLARAGYFERLGMQPELGYVDDDATNQAWKLALNESVKRGIGVPELLQQQIDEFAARRRDQMTKFNVTDTRLAANQIAIDAIGRSLTSEEFTKVRGFLVSLQNERRDQILGVAGTDLSWRRDGMDMQTGFDETDIEQAVAGQVQGNIGAQNAYSTGRSLFKYLGREFPTEPVSTDRQEI